VPFIMVVWGTIMSLMCLVNSFRGLVMAHFFLGLTEGGLFPGLTYYLSLWYPCQMQAKCIGTFSAVSTVAGAFSGLLVTFNWIKASLHGWQWIMHLLVLTDARLDPASTTFLTEEERRFVIQTLVNDSKGQASHLSAKFVWQALTNWKTYVLAITAMCIFINGYCIFLFVPTIIHDLGYSSVNAQLLLVPPSACATIFTVAVCFYSDKKNLWGLFIVLFSTISMIGYIITYTMSKLGPGYVAVFFTACGTYPNAALLLVWARGNSGGNLKRGAVLALVIGLGNLGGICSSFIYYQLPHFHTGHGTVIGCLGLSIVCTCIIMWTYKRLNKEKEELCTHEGINESMKDMYHDLADKSPLFW
ncbi:major facilitator superfamily domain-containing protein, partial [Lactarius quietus]